MKTTNAIRIIGAVALLASAASVAGCAGEQHSTGWSNQWYRPHHSPEEEAKRAQKRREHPRPTNDDATNPTAETGGGSSAN